MSVRSHITLHVIPTSASGHISLAGSAGLLEFTTMDPVVATRNDAAGYFLEEPDDVAVYEKIFSSLTAIALDPAKSRQLVGRLGAELNNSMDGRRP